MSNLMDQVIKEYKMESSSHKRIKRMSDAMEIYLKLLTSKTPNLSMKDKKVTLISSDNVKINIPYYFLYYIKTLYNMISDTINVETQEIVIPINIPEKFIRYIVYYIKTGEVSYQALKNSEDLETLFRIADFWEIVQPE